jgi:primosomal protein N' (replication factor Y)
VDVVVERGRRDGAPVLLVSPCPTVALCEGRTVVTTDREVERRGWPAVEVVDRRADDPRTGLFSDRLAATARAELARPGGRVVCILHRTGRVRVLACAACGALARCTGCGGPLSRPEADGPLACGRCGSERPPVCAACDSARLKALRIGVSRATEELGALLGQSATEVTASADSHGPVGPLVMGTEAALHRIDHAGLVAFLDFDQHLLAPRFGAGEESLGLLARAARLVGARSGGGRVLVQTRIPDHEALRAAVAADPTMLSVPERDLRSALGLPPFGALAGLSGAAAEAYAAGLRASSAPLEVSSLDEDRFLVRAADHGALCDGLADAARPAGRLRVEVDTRDA